MSRFLRVIFAAIACYQSCSPIASAQAVRVTCERRDCVGQRYCRTVRDCGTGVVIGTNDRVSYVLTAAHVVSGGGTLQVQSQPARVVAADSQSDIALIEVYGRYEGPLAVVGSTPERSTVRIIGLGAEPARFDGSLTSPTWVDVGVRDGDSGGPVYVGETLTLVGLVSGVDAKTQQTTNIVPAATLIAFTSRHCPQFCRPSQAQAPAPIVSSDIPDREKTARIASLESRLAAAESRLQRLQQQASSITSVIGPVGPPGPPGREGKPGKDAVAIPLTVTLNTLDDAGKVVGTVTKTYQPGEPVILNFRPISSK